MTPEPHTAGATAASNRKVAIGALASGVVNISKIAIQLLLLPVLARLLGPDEFGLFALALPVITFVILLADGGLGASLAREDESSHSVWSSAFWALTVMGVVLAVVTTAFGFLLGYLSDQPRLPAIVAVLSLSLICLTLSVIPAARLLRQKNLGVGAGSDLAGTIIAAITAVVLASYGAGAWSLAIQYLVLNAVRSVILNLAAFYLPRFEFNFSALRPHLVTGGILVGSRMSEFAGKIAENLLVNRLFGTTLLGNYTFANQVSKFFSDAASNTVWGGLYVQALTGDRKAIVLLHRQLCRLLGILLFPTTFLAAAAAPELVSIFLGPKWVGLPFFLRLLLPIYALSAIASQSGAILLANNRFGIQFWCTLGLSLGRVAAIAVGFSIGMEGAMYCLVAVTVLFSAAMMHFSAKATGSYPLPILAGLIRPAAASVIAVVVFLLLDSWASPNIPWTFGCLLVGFISYLGLMLLFDRRQVLEDMNSVRSVFSSRKS